MYNSKSKQKNRKERLQAAPGLFWLNEKNKPEKTQKQAKKAFCNKRKKPVFQ
jgi:hypothetical protein